MAQMAKPTVGKTKELDLFIVMTYLLNLRTASRALIEFFRGGHLINTFCYLGLKTLGTFIIL